MQQNSFLFTVSYRCKGKRIFMWNTAGSSRIKEEEGVSQTALQWGERSAIYSARVVWEPPFFLWNRNHHTRQTSTNDGTVSKGLENEVVCLIGMGCYLCPKSTLLSSLKGLWALKCSRALSQSLPRCWVSRTERGKWSDAKLSSLCPFWSPCSHRHKQSQLSGWGAFVDLSVYSQNVGKQHF